MDGDANGDAPLEFSPAAETLRPPFRDDFPGYANGMCRVRPSGLLMVAEFAKYADAIRRLRLRSDDTFVLSFPKSGTTWTQEMVWLIQNDCDFQTAQSDLLSRSPFLEQPFMMSVARTAEEDVRHIETSLEKLDKMGPKRVIMSHLPLALMNPQLLDTCKVVYVARNPKDVIVSYYHHHKLFKMYGFNGDIDVFADYFLTDQIMFGPYFPHLMAAWKQRHHPNMHFLFYEDLKQDLKGGIRKVADFLEKPLTDEQLDRLTVHLSFDCFAKNAAVNKENLRAKGVYKEGKFVRKGKTGDWKNHFDPQLNERIDRWIESNLTGSDLKFVTELENQD